MAAEEQALRRKAGLQGRMGTDRWSLHGLNEEYRKQHKRVREGLWDV